MHELTWCNFIIVIILYSQEMSCFNQFIGFLYKLKTKFLYLSDEGKCYPLKGCEHIILNIYMILRVGFERLHLNFDNVEM